MWGAPYRHPNSSCFTNSGRKPTKTPYHHQQQKQNQSRPAWNKKTTEDKTYVCPGCHQNYDFKNHNGQLYGNVPLVLNCMHSLCQDCVYKQSHSTQVICPTCKQSSTLSRYTIASCNDLQDVFIPNLYILGYLLYNKSQNNKKNTCSLPVGLALRCQVTQQQPESPPLDHREKCCFHVCTNAAEIYCLDCNDNYCRECNFGVHKSAKTMWGHKHKPLTSANLSFDLENCRAHKQMAQEYVCNECDLPVCVYCLVEEHTGHKKTQLNILSEADKLKLDELIDKAKVTLKQLKSTQSKIKKLSNGDATESVELKIRSYFGDLHARLHDVEKALLEDAGLLRADGKGLESLSRVVDLSVSNVERMVTAARKTDAKNVNFKELVKCLEGLEGTPTFLVSGNAPDSFGLYVDPSMDNIRDKFKVIKPEDMSYKLVTEDDLPPDYVDDVHSDTTSQISEAAGIISNPASGSSDVESVHPSTDKPHYQIIQVTHVESVDCFYALQNKLTRLYNQMERIIKQHVHNSLEFVQNPEINKIYLFEEKKGKQSKWLRGRLVDIQKNNDEEVSYELFLVDRGSTVVVPDNTLIEATTHIIQIKPFVIQCQLHNPTSSSWSLESNKYFVKLIENKSLNMFIKNTHGQMHEVDLLISTTLGNQTSVVELLLNTYSNVLSSADESYALMSRKRLKICDVKLYPNSVRLTKELSISVVLSFVSNPHRVFVQEARNQRVIQTLREDLQRYYGNNKKVKECAPIEGSYVVVKYQDNVRYRYHRGLIKTVDFHNDIVNVILVDWGKTVNVPTSAIAVLAEQFTKLEIQAIQVKLAHIAPVGSCKMWESNAIEYLNNYVSHKNILKMTICKEHPLEVVLFEKMGAYDCCINAQLVDLKIASSTGNLSTVSKWPQASESPEQKDSSFIGNLLDSLQVDDDDEEEEVKGTSQLIKVVKVIDPDLIYVSFPARQDSSHALHKELQIHYSNDRVTKHKWDVGEWCVVRNPDNSVYCRGKITEVLPDNRYKVYVMDYVTEHVLEADQIYVHHDYFKKYLDTVYKMCLTEIRPAGGADKWSSTAIETLEKIVERHSQMYATKNGEGINDVFPVDMWYKHYKESGPLDPVHVKYVSVSNILVKLGLAKKTVTEGSKKEIKPETNKESPYHKQELPMADWLPPFPIDKSSFDAQITCAEDITGLLYIRDDDLQEAYETLEKEMKEYFDKDKPSRKTEVWLPNQICTIAYQDYWYRGKIVSVEDANTVTAKMIDFGSTHILTPDDIYVEILYPNIQAMANKIELYNVHSKSGSWLPSDHDTLMEIIKTKAKIVIRDGSTEVPQADVYLYPSGVLLNRQLVRLSSNLYAKNVSVDEGADGLIVVEDEQVVTQSTDEECEAANQVNELKDFVAAELPKNVYTKVTPMTVLNVLSCDTIILTYSGDDYFMNDGLIELIQQNGGDCPVMNDIQKGKPCVCPFSEDNLYYRCRIEDVTNLEFGMVEVYFVDFGNSEGVLVNDVREIPDAWLKEPVFNCKAKLDVEVSNPAQRKLLGQKLKKMIMTVQDIQILEKDPLTIKILDSNGDSIFHNIIANIK